MNQQVTDFFAKFEQANARADVEQIGSLYAETFMFAGPKGVQPVKKEDFLKVIPRMKAHYSSLGLAGTELRTVDARELDSKYLLATVIWRLKLLTPLEHQPTDISATYILAREPDGALSIVFQIDHQDLAAVVLAQQRP